MEELCVVTEYNEGRRSYRYLRHIINFETSALIGGRLNAHSSLCKYLVEHTRGNTVVRVSKYLVYVLKKGIDTLSRKS
jgi:hypothetical protein